MKTLADFKRIKTNEQVMFISNYVSTPIKRTVVKNQSNAKAFTSLNADGQGASWIYFDGSSAKSRFVYDGWLIFPLSDKISHEEHDTIVDCIDNRVRTNMIQFVAYREVVS